MASCDVTSDNEPDKDINPKVTGTKYGISKVTIDEAYTALKTALNNNDQMA